MKKRITEDLDGGSGLIVLGESRDRNRFVEPIDMIGEGGSVFLEGGPASC